MVMEEGERMSEILDIIACATEMRLHYSGARSARVALNENEREREREREREDME